MLWVRSYFVSDQLAYKSADMTAYRALRTGLKPLEGSHSCSTYPASPPPGYDELPKGAASIRLRGAGCLVGSIKMRPQGFIPVSRIVGLLILLPTLLLVALGVYFYLSARAFEQRSVSCQGKVVDLQSSEGEHGTLYTPLFTYTDALGVVRRGRSNTSSNPPAYAIGDPIPLRYDPQNPSDVRVDSFWTFWLGPTICAFIAIPFLVFALIFLLLVPFAIRRVWPEPSNTAVQPSRGGS